MQTVVLVHDYKRLKERIRLLFDNQQSFANAMGITLQTVNNKLNGRSCFTIDEVLAWSSFLSIGIYEIPDYFFCRSIFSESEETSEERKEME